MASYLFSSESITGGHPDPVSDAILDGCLAVAPYGKGNSTASARA